MNIRAPIRRQWQQQRAATIFLVLGLLFGLIFIGIVPPTQVADETTHFYRAYELSDGEILAHPIEHGYGATLPNRVYTDSKQMFGDIPSHFEKKFDYHKLSYFLKQKIDTRDTREVHLEGAAVYSPAGYGPQILAIQIMKSVWPSVAAMYYAGRVLNLLLWLILTYLAIRIWPGSKWGIFALAMLPMTVQQAASLSPDATINGLAFLAVAGAFYWSKTQTKLGWRQVGLAFLILGILSLSKPIFFTFALLGLLFYRKIDTSRRVQIGILVGLIGWGLLLTMGWNALVKDFSEGIQYYYYSRVDIDAGRQLAGILGQPLRYVQALGHTYLTTNSNVIVHSFIGRLAWWEIDLPLWMIVMAYATLLLGIFSTDAERPVRVRRMTRAISLVVFALGFLAINTTLYMTITRVHAHYIEGVQGRYFIALAPLLALGCAGLLPIKNWERIAGRLYPAVYTLLLTASCAIIVARFT